jgi:hypothetical protein
VNFVVVIVDQRRLVVEAPTRTKVHLVVAIVSLSVSQTIERDPLVGVVVVPMQVHPLLNRVYVELIDVLEVFLPPTGGQTHLLRLLLVLYAYMVVKLKDILPCSHLPLAKSK